MAIFNKSTESAQTAVAKAEAVVMEWEAKAATARTQAAELDANSGSLILADESAAESIGLQIQTLERKARAFDQAAAEAGRKLNAAQREVLEAEAREEDKLQAQDEKALIKHDERTAELMKALADHNGDVYVMNNSPMAIGETRHVPRSELLQQSAVRHQIRAAAIRYFIATGKTPNDLYEINNVLRTNLNAFLYSLSDGVPQSVYAARDAGLSFVGA